MKQLVQLQENLDSFTDQGIAVVAITYDAPELQQAFVDKYNIAYPLFSDIEASSVKTLKILNEEYQPGDRSYGIPHPGIYVLNSDMEIVGKLFVEAYSSRVDAEGVLKFAMEVLN